MSKFRLAFLCENRGFLLACDDILELQAKKFAYVIGKQSHRRFLSKALRIRRTKWRSRQGHHSYVVTADTYGHVLAELGRERTDTKIWKFQRLQKVMKKAAFHTKSCFCWQPKKDSNPHKQSQSYHNMQAVPYFRVFWRDVDSI